jgi:hypothetical protein
MVLLVAFGITSVSFIGLYDDPKYLKMLLPSLAIAKLLQIDYYTNIPNFVED